MRVVWLGITLQACLVATPAIAASFTYSDGICEYRVAYDAAAYRARCAAHHERLARLAMIDNAEVAALRDRELADLDATCNRVAASLAAAKGDVAPARALAPACIRYADLLALPAPALKAKFNDLVMDLCQASTEVDICAGELQRRGEGPGSETRRRLAVLERWAECARTPDSVIDGSKRKLLETLAERFKAKATSCAR